MSLQAIAPPPTTVRPEADFLSFFARVKGKMGAKLVFVSTKYSIFVLPSCLRIPYGN